LSDYIRRVSSTAIVKAFYIDLVSQPMLCAQASAIVFQSCTIKRMSGIVGLAAGGKMYGSFDSTLLFVSLIA
jgi:hypothetical protein